MVMTRAVFTSVSTTRVSVAWSQRATHILKHPKEAGTDVIAEAANDGYWHAGQLRLSGAIGGTQLAAVAYFFQSQQQLRVYYQAQDLTLREHGHNDGGWFTGRLIVPV
jgi:hypothetical protein